MKRNKLLYRSVILLAFLALNGFILFGISQILAYLNTGADTSKLLHLGTALKTDYIPHLQWTDIKNPGRPLEPYTQEKIARDYLDAWYVRQVAFNSGDPNGIEDHYTAMSRQKLYALLDENNAQDVRVESTTLSHHLSLEFYSADGTLAVLRDTNLERYQRVFKHDFLQFQGTEIADYRVVLLLENGVWRIRHIQQLAQHEPPVIQALDFLPKGAIEGINYYTQDAPWDTFGESYTTQRTQTDFAYIKELNLNTIRIFIGYEDFGKGAVKPEKLNRLLDLLNVAAASDLKVIVTLFDFYGNYALTDWAQTQQHLTTLVKAIQEHPALIAWDLKNEPDLDFDSRGELLVHAWLSQMIKVIKRIDTTHPITIGWSSAAAALQLEDQVDYISFHHYTALDELPEIMTMLSSQTEKPIVLEEFGRSANQGLWNPLGYSRKSQAAYYQEFFTTQGRPVHFLSWTLYDFEHIPNQVAGPYPWRKQKQQYFGLIDKNGEKNEAFEVVKNR